MNKILNIDVDENEIRPFEFIPKGAIRYPKGNSWYNLSWVDPTRSGEIVVLNNFLDHRFNNSEYAAKENIVRRFSND